MKQKLEALIQQYYGDRLTMHGDTARGADWNDAQSQIRRFEALLDGVQPEDSILDIGCGTGALYGHLLQSGYSGEYQGFDITEEAINLALKTYGPHFTSDVTHCRAAKHVIMSGVFHVKGAADNDVWERYIEESISEFNNLCTSSLRINFLGPLPDRGNEPERLYFANLNIIWALARGLNGTKIVLESVRDLWDVTLRIEKER